MRERERETKKEGEKKRERNRSRERKRESIKEGEIGRERGRVRYRMSLNGRIKKKKRMRNKGRNMYWGSSASGLNYASRSRQIVCRQNRQAVAATKLLRRV